MHILFCSAVQPISCPAPLSMNFLFLFTFFLTYYPNVCLLISKILSLLETLFFDVCRMIFCFGLCIIRMFYISIALKRDCSKARHQWMTH